MKAFFLLVLLFLAFVFFASSNVSQADLNPYASQSGYVAPTAATGATTGTGSDVVTINNNTAQSSYAVPVTGTCSNPYTVQSGDTLSGIAALCNTTVAALQAVNPSVAANPNLIYPGQQLVTSGTGQASQSANTVQQVPVTGSIEDKNTVPTAAPANPPTSAYPAPQINVVPSQQPNNAAPIIPQTGPGPRLAAGSQVQVKAFNFPANTPVSIAIGPQSSGYNVVAASITDANGGVTANISLPTAGDPNTPFVVVVATTGSHVIQGMSKPFYLYTVTP